MPAKSAYHPEDAARYFDTFGEREWQRMVSNPVNEISLFLHTHYLRQFLRPGMRVLEIGAGAGRFTQVLAELNTRVVVADISPVQVQLNRQHAAELGFARAVEQWLEADICDLRLFPEGDFDAVVAYGGPFSYVLDQRDRALQECRRVLKPAGLLLCSVMCLWGSVHRALKEILLNTPPEVNQRIIASGDITPATYPQRPASFMHLFNSAELNAWLRRSGFDVLHLSASGVLGAGWDEALQAVRADEALWQELLQMEQQASVQPGCLDMGTHLIAAARKA